MTFQYIPRDVVKVPEIKFKDRVQLPAQKTALVIVDMQNDFVKPNGKLMVPAASSTVSV